MSNSPHDQPQDNVQDATQRKAEGVDRRDVLLSSATLAAATALHCSLRVSERRRPREPV
jgi:hypothetical protein